MNPYFHDKEETGVPFFPHHLVKELMVMFLMLALISLLTVLLPAPMEPKADPFTTPEHIKPEWYFLCAYQILKVAEHLSFLGDWAPKTIGVLGQGIFFAVLVLLPFLDRNPERHPRKRLFMIALGIFCVIFFGIFTWWGHVS